MMKKIFTANLQVKKLLTDEMLLKIKFVSGGTAGYVTKFVGQTRTLLKKENKN